MHLRLRADSKEQGAHIQLPVCKKEQKLTTFMDFFCSWYDDDECDDNNVQRNPWKGLLLACNNRYCCLLARLCLAWRPRCDTSHGHKEPCEASRGQRALTSADQDLSSSQDTQVTWPVLILSSIIGKNGAAYRQHFPRTDTIVNKTKSPNYSQYSPRVLPSPRVWQLSHDLCSRVLCAALMASLADLVTSWAGLEIFSWPSCVTIERRQVIQGSQGNWSGCPLSTRCIVMFVIMMHSLQHNYPDELLVCKQKSVNFMMNPLIRSLTAAQTTTDPKNKIQITQRTKCITFTSSSLIKESTVKRVKEKCVFPSFSLESSLQMSCIVSIVSVVGPWLPESSCIPLASFPLISAHLLASDPILLFHSSVRKWNAPALIIIALVSHNNQEQKLHFLWKCQE